MTQSVMDSGHPWHMFKVKESFTSSTSTADISSDNYMITKLSLNLLTRMYKNTLKYNCNIYIMNIVYMDITFERSDTSNIYIKKS